MELKIVTDVNCDYLDNEKKEKYYEVIHEKLEDFCKKLKKIHNLDEGQLVVKKFSSIDKKYSKVINEYFTTGYLERGELIDFVKNYVLGNEKPNERVFLVDWDAIANEKLIKNISNRREDVAFQILSKKLYLDNTMDIIDHGCILRNKDNEKLEKLLKIFYTENPIFYMQYCILKSQNLIDSEFDISNTNSEILTDLNEKWTQYIEKIEPIKDDKEKGLT